MVMEATRISRLRKAIYLLGSEGRKQTRVVIVRPGRNQISESSALAVCGSLARLDRLFSILFPFLLSFSEQTGFIVYSIWKNMID
jgi:hypothetical protein